MPEPLRVLLVSSEVSPFAKTGGLADVMAALPSALRHRGVDARLLLPRYRWIAREGLHQHAEPLGVPLGAQEHWCAIFEGELGGCPIYFLEHDALYDRPHLYGPEGSGYPDNALRFALLSRAALQLCHHLQWWPQVLHANDWQTALVPVYLNTVAREGPLAQSASLLTIHNLAYQGWFPKQHLVHLGQDRALLQHLGLEASGYINLLKGGVHHATLVTTVSPSYAKEIQTPAFGEGLDGVLRSRAGDLFGVLNGIDLDLWDPRHDPLLPRRYSAEDLAGKRYCKAALQQEAGLLPRPEVPLLGMVTRLSAQKGIDLVAAALPQLLELDLQLVLLGDGDRRAGDYLKELAAQHPQRLGVWISFDDRLAHLIEAGSDLFLMPSRWEPCGLNQMYSMRYGTIPLVRDTGGLRDTGRAFDPATGLGNCFKFHDLTVEALLEAAGQAVTLYRNNKTVWRSLIQQAMAEDHSWSRSAATYEYFYRLAYVRRQGF